LVRQWHEKASDDLMAATVIVNAELPTYWTVSFHAQQAAEKVLKALLTRHQIEFLRTHSIGELLLLVEPIVPGISGRLDAARDLTRHAVADRYPGSDEGPVGREAAGRHLDIAKAVIDTVSVELRPYLEAGPPTG
jgi:HEPN domain-containing protein